MIADLLTMVWKEQRELIRTPTSMLAGSRIDGLLSMLGPVAFAVAVPLLAKEAWVTTRISLIAVAWIPLVMMLFAIADSFAGERERHTLETLLATRLSDEAILVGKIASLVIGAWVQAVTILLIGLVVVNVVHRDGPLLMFAGLDVVAFLVLTLLVSILEACGGVLVCLRAATVKQAGLYLFAAFSAVLFGGLYIASPKFLPAPWRQAFMEQLPGSQLKGLILLALVLVAANGILYAAARIRFRRARLIVE